MSTQAIIPPYSPAAGASPTDTRHASQLSFAERDALQARLVAEAGWSQPETIVPKGTALIPVGVEKMRALKASIDGLPDAAVALNLFIAAQEARRPHDATAPIGCLRMNPTGHIYRASTPDKAIGYTHTGLSQLVSFYGEVMGVPRNWVNGLEFLSPAARAVAFNDMATRAEARKDFDTAPRVMRTLLNGNGDRMLRAVTSTKHVLDKGDGRAVGKMLQACLPKGAKLRISQTWDRIDFEVYFPMMNREIVVGDIVLGRASISISETKDISADVFAGLLRALCLNFTTAWFGEGSIFNAKHMGAAFINRLSKAFSQAVTKIEPFARAFGDAYKTALPAGQTRASVLGKVGRAFELESDTIKLAMAQWDADGLKGAGSTLAGTVNALTRASQALTFANAAKVEAAAGELAARGWVVLETGPAGRSEAELVN